MIRGLDWTLLQILPSAVSIRMLNSSTEFSASVIKLVISRNCLALYTICLTYFTVFCSLLIFSSHSLISLNTLNIYYYWTCLLQSLMSLHIWFFCFVSVSPCFKCLISLCFRSVTVSWIIGLGIWSVEFLWGPGWHCSPPAWGTTYLRPLQVQWSFEVFKPHRENAFGLKIHLEASLYHKCSGKFFF